MGVGFDILLFYLTFFYSFSFYLVIFQLFQLLGRFTHIIAHFTLLGYNYGISKWVSYFITASYTKVSLVIRVNVLPGVVATNCARFIMNIQQAVPGSPGTSDVGGQQLGDVPCQQRTHGLLLLLANENRHHAIIFVTVLHFSIIFKKSEIISSLN